MNGHWKFARSHKCARFRTLGCYPLTGAIESDADSLDAIVAEMLTTRLSERQRRLIDGDEAASMEKRRNGKDTSDARATARPLRRRKTSFGLGEVAKLITEAGLIVLCPFISPYRAEREMVRKLAPQGDFIEIFADTPLEECTRRDPKGLNAKAKTEGIANFRGLDAPYEPPETPEIHPQTSNEQPKQSAERVVKYLADRGIVSPP